jgi:hypothetical protein
LAIPVLLILAVLWAAVLVPPVLRSRTESRRGGVGDFTSRLGALTGRHSSPRSMGARPGRSLRAMPAPRLGGSTRPAGVTGRPGSGARPERSPSQPVAAATASAMTPAQKRRRDVLLILGGAAVATFLLALMAGSPLLWLLQLLADVMLGVYVFLLVQFKQRGSVASPFAGSSPWSPAAPSSRPVALAHPRVPARPELAPLPQASPLGRTAAR